VIGRVLNGTYRIYDRVGTGSFATVYLGRNLKTNEVVAVRVLSRGAPIQVTIDPNKKASHRMG
jgi:serine/threonine protein kinase